MKSITSGHCLVGSELLSLCEKAKVRRDIKREIAILPKYNQHNYVIESRANCKIINKVSKLTDEEYVECMKVIRKNGFQPFDNVGYEIKGNEIACECDNNQDCSRTILTFKSKIALALLIRSFPKGGTYKMNETYMGVPKFKLRE